MTGRHNFLERGWGPLEPFDDVLPGNCAKRAGRKAFSHLITDHYHYFLKYLRDALTRIQAPIEQAARLGL